MEIEVLPENDFAVTFSDINVYAPVGATVDKVQQRVGRYVIYTGILFPVDREMTIETSDETSDISYYQIIETVDSGEIEYQLVNEDGRVLCEISYFEGGMSASWGEYPCMTLLSSELDGVAGFSGNHGGVILLGDFEEVMIR